MYSIGEAARILGVRTSVLRHWEQEFPVLKPRKDPYGNRTYSKADLALLLRIRYLLYERKFTTEGAREQLWKEFSDEHTDLRSAIRAVRAELASALCLLSRDTHSKSGS